MTSPLLFDLDNCLDVLERTPDVLERLLAGLDDSWTRSTEGPETWSPYDVIGHLIHGERTDWTERMDIILSDQSDKRFVPFDRFAQFRESEGRTLEDLLREFSQLRRTNVARVRALRLTCEQLDRTGIHPHFGAVTLRQLLATWTAHDLDHIVQASRVMARQLAAHVGPWVEYLRVIREVRDRH
jgi:hypothetical protein